MKRPLLVGLYFLIMGILAGQYITISAGIALFFASVIFACVWLYIKYRYKPVFLFMLASAIGMVAITDAKRPLNPEADGLARAGKNVVMRGVVKDVAWTESGWLRTVVLTSEIESGGHIYSAGFLIQCYFEEESEVKPGDRLVSSGKLSLPSHARNPGGFDEYFYLKARGIAYKSFCTLIEINEHENSLESFLTSIRQKLADVYDSTLPRTEAGIAKSIILGDKSDIDPDITQLYRAGGIYHILAISGLHISTIILLLNSLLKRIFPYRLSGGILLVLISLYCIMTGASPSTVRAVIMAGVVIAGRGTPFYRTADLRTSAAFACSCILLYRPFYLWDMGFLYSFSAVFSIAFLTPAIERFFVLIGAKWRYAKIILNSYLAKNYLASSLAVFIGCLPLSLRTIYYLQPLSIFINLLVLPTVFLLLLAGVLTGVIGLISVPAASFIAGSVYYLLKLYQILCQSTAGAQVLTGHMPTVMVLAYYLILGGFVKCLTSFGDDFKRYGKYCTTASLCFAVATGIKAYAPTPLTITMLDVGQGDCFVLTKNHVTIVIDGGGRRNAEYGNNTGARVLRPYLDYLAIGNVDAVFLTHTDYDHSAGILELLDLRSVDTLFLPHTNYDNDTTFDEIVKKVKKNGTYMELLEADYVISIGEGFSISCLSPIHGKSIGGGNDDSLVLLVSDEQNSFLFTGDISEHTETQLVESGVSLRANVLKLAHHGSAKSNSADFLRAVSPDAAIVSTGIGNTYGHPSAEVAVRLNEVGIPLLDTAENGAVIIESNKGILKIRTMLK